MLIEPCNYWRNVEVPAVLSHLRAQPGERILDIGSPKLPSLFLWSRFGAQVYATDLLAYFVDEYSYYSERLRRHSSGSEYHIDVQDARALSYEDCYFDKVYAISVIEHIEGDGDSQAMREIARVLKPGGVCCLTVPSAMKYEEHMVNPELYHNFYYNLRKSKHANGSTVFWQRRYDADSLRSRLIVPSGLELSELEFYGERWFPFEQFYSSLPFILRVIFSVPGPAFSKLFLHRLDSSRPSKPKAALLALRKS